MKKLVLLVQFLHNIWGIVSPLEIYKLKILNFVNRMAIKQHPALVPTSLSSLNLSKAMWLDYQFLHICESKNDIVQSKQNASLSSIKNPPLHLPNFQPYLWLWNKIVFYTCTHNGPQKIWQTIWKLETKVVTDDKTRVGCAIVAFHMRNWLPTKNWKSWISWIMFIEWRWSTTQLMFLPDWAY